MKKIIHKVQNKVKSLIPHEQENPETRYFKLLLWGLVGIFVLGLLAGTLSFFLMLNGGEETLVPNLEGVELVSALEELQSRGLYVHVQRRFFSDPALKGFVIDQRPNPGSQVRVGRTVNLTVSMGPVVDEVGDYKGLTLDDLRRQLAAQFVNYEALLEVKADNISYKFSEELENTILDQDPAPGTKLGGYTELRLLVSRGPEVLGAEAPEAVGLDYRQALGMLAVRKVPFVFREISQPKDDAIEGLVVSQFPLAGELIEPGSPLVLRINPIESQAVHDVADIYYSFVPEFALPVEIRVEIVDPEGEKLQYFVTEHAGGELSFPYVLEQGSQINIYADGAIISRYTVSPVGAEFSGGEEG